MVNRGYDDDNDNDYRPSGGVGSSSIAYESPRRKPGRRRLLTLLIAAVALGGFIGIVWHAYNQGKNSGEAVVPLLQADDGPIKVRPDQPGGMDVPNQDKLIYGRIDHVPGNATPQVERLLPPPEAPVARPVAPVPEPASPDSQAAQPTETAQAPSEASSELQAPPLPATPPASTAPSAAQPQSQQPQPQPPAEPQARPAPSAPQQTAAVPSGAGRIQLGAVRSSDAAKKEWTRIQNANKDLLGGMSLNVEQANLGSRGTYYRIQAGPAADPSDLCAKLKARNIGCIVVR